MQSIDKKILTRTIRKLTLQKKLIIKQLIIDNDVALTTDFWTSGSEEGYMSLTMHYIDDKFNFRSLAAECAPITGSKTASDIKGALDNFESFYGLKKSSVAAVVTDNEATNNLLGDLLEEDDRISWIGCIDHLLELIAKSTYDLRRIHNEENNDFLNDFTEPEVEKYKELANFTNKCRLLVSKFKQSTQLSEKLQKYQRELRERKVPLQVVQDVKTRWWSTHSMLERLIELKVEIVTLGQLNALSIDVILSDAEWEVVTNLVEVLKPWRDLQLFFEGDEYITSSLVPMYLNKIRKYLNEKSKEFEQKIETNTNSLVDNIMHNILAAMKSKFVEIFLERDYTKVFHYPYRPRGNRRIRRGLHPNFFFASFLDWRCKLKVEDFPDEEIPFFLASLKREIILLFKPFANEKQNNTESQTDKEMNEENSSSEDEFGEIMKFSSTNNDIRSLPPHSGRHSSISTKNNAEKTTYFERFSISKENFESKLAMEIESYLAESRIKVKYPSADVLALWQKNVTKYPILAKMARRVLCIPATSAASERIFSSGGVVVTKRRNRLDSDMVNDLVFLKGCWNKLDIILLESGIQPEAMLLKIKKESEVIDIEEIHVIEIM